MSDFWTAAFANLSLTLGALAIGFWAVLSYFWIRRFHGAFRVALIWVSVNTIAALGIRLYTQVQNYSDDSFPAIDWARLAFNVSVLGLGVYLAKNSGRIIKEGDLN